jgi:hypothetical protein
MTEVSETSIDNDGFVGWLHMLRAQRAIGFVPQRPIRLSSSISFDPHSPPYFSKSTLALDAAPCRY